MHLADPLLKIFNQRNGVRTRGHMSFQDKKKVIHQQGNVGNGTDLEMNIPCNIINQRIHWHYELTGDAKGEDILLRVINLLTTLLRAANCGNQKV